MSRSSTIHSQGGKARSWQIRRANPADAAALSAIAWAAKAHWGYPARWMEEWRELLTITPEFIAGNETFAAIIDNRIVGFDALHEAGGHLRLEHLWIEPGQIGCGIGRALFQHAAERAVTLGALGLTIESDPNAEAFYRHMGAVRIGQVMSEVAGRRRELPLLEFDLTGRRLELRKDPSKFRRVNRRRPRGGRDGLRGRAESASHPTAFAARA